MRQPFHEAYELVRDDMQETSCWRAHDNQCMPHFHASIELLYVEQGEISALLDGHQYTARKGQVVLCSSYTVHTYHTESYNDVILVIIPYSSVPSLQKTLNKKVFASPLYTCGEGDELPKLLAMMAEGWDEYSVHTRKGFSYAVLGLLIAKVGLSDAVVGLQGSLMQQVLAYLMEHYQQPLTLEALARQFGYSKSRFARLFHDHLGCAMNEYLAALRCRHAARLLLESDQTMLDIALGVGFSCLRTFYRAFHAAYAMTPTQYIRAYTKAE